MSRGPPLAASFARIAAIFACAIACLGCARSGEAVQEIGTWTLTVAGKEAATSRVQLPAHLDAVLPTTRARYTLRSDVTLVPALRGRDLVLALPSLPALVELRVNGVVVPALAEEEPESPPAYRRRGPHAWRVAAAQTAGGRVDLEIDVEHTWPMSGWIEAAPRLSATPGGDAGYRRVAFILDAGNTIALGAMGSTGFTYLVLFLLAPARRHYGWFALQAAAAAHYPLFLTGWTQIAGSLDTGLLALSQTVAALAGLHFTYAAFGLGRTPRWPLAGAALASVAGLLVRDRFAQLRVLAPFTWVMCIAIVVLQLSRLAKLGERAQARATASILAVAWVSVLAALAVDGGAFVGLGTYLGGVRIGSWALALVAMAQATALSREHVVSLRRSDGLNRDLAQHVREIESLNVELRRRIAERSREVRASIAGAWSASPWRKVGDVFAGRYRVERMIGAGGMGRVYEVASLQDDRRLALKVVEKDADAESLTRFTREAELAARVSHPNVVSIVDFDVGDDGLPFLVMELVPGATLERHRDKFGDVPWALSVLAQIAAGLEAIHAQSIVHRDLKPGNVLIEDTPIGPRARITDFGISRATADAASMADTAPPSGLTRRDEPTDGPARATGLTRTGSLLGTPSYMAPEVASGSREATPAADTFALAVMAFELLTGRYPFVEPPVVTARRGERPRPVTRLADGNGAVPPALSALIDEMLTCDPPLRRKARDLAATIPSPHATAA